MKTWFQCFRSVKEMRAGGVLPKNLADRTTALTNRSNGSGSNATGGKEDGDWWEDVSHQAQRVAHVAAASAFAAGEEVSVVMDVRGGAPGWGGIRIILKMDHSPKDFLIEQDGVGTWDFR